MATNRKIKRIWAFLATFSQAVRQPILALEWPNYPSRSCNCPNGPKGPKSKQNKQTRSKALSPLACMHNWALCSFNE